MSTGKPLLCRLGLHEYEDFPDPNARRDRRSGEAGLKGLYPVLERKGFEVVSVAFRPVPVAAGTAPGSAGGTTAAPAPGLRPPLAFLGDGPRPMIEPHTDSATTRKPLLSHTSGVSFDVSYEALAVLGG